jgi:hypothetical protein
MITGRERLMISVRHLVGVTAYISQSTNTRCTMMMMIMIVIIIIIRPVVIIRRSDSRVPVPMVGQ